MAYSIYIIEGKKVKEDRPKKINCKKNGKRISKYLGAHRHTQERIEKVFFFGFCDFIIFLDFGFIFAVRCLKITDFVSFPYYTNPVHYISGNNEYELLPLVSREGYCNFQF